MRIDHLVWYCADLQEGVRRIAERLGCEPAYGGVHPGEGTRNSLISLGDSTYIEILAPDPDQAPGSMDPELRALVGAGLYHWAIGVTDLERVRDRAIASDLQTSDLVRGGRTLPDGSWLGWRLLGIGNHAFGSLVPFFIDWMESEHPASRAPRGGRLDAIQATSPAPERLRAVYEAIDLDVPVTPGPVAGLRATVSGGAGTLELRTFAPLPRGFVI